MESGGRGLNSGSAARAYSENEVGTNGRVEPGSIKVISSPHKQFSEAVRAALLNAKFRPAQVGGHAVRQLVEQSFSFRLEK